MGVSKNADIYRPTQLLPVYVHEIQISIQRQFKVVKSCYLVLTSTKLQIEKSFLKML